VGQAELYEEAAAAFGPALDRMARAYEADADLRRDLTQEIHLALWRSFTGFDGRCSLRTWVYRVAHNTAASHIRRRRPVVYVGLEELQSMPDPRPAANTDEAHQLAALMALIQSLKPLDRQVILAYLEGLDAAAISEFTGLSPGNVATKIHRIKHILTERSSQ
jgi:RNA polymerase sigma-70 factor (ECF subfamily)